MRLSRIYASEIYVTSTRKDRIHAAINDPMNIELVQQLSDYLDDDSKEQLQKAVDDKQDKKISENEGSSEEVIEEVDAEVQENDFPDSENNVFSPSYKGTSQPAESANNSNSSEPDIFDIPKSEADSEIKETPASNSAPVEETTQVSKKAIVADTDIDDLIFDIANEIEVIKGTLNSREDTSGVQRVNIDNRELWIYYKDEVNIGDIMVDVIEVLNGTNYTYLTFSRLARSNNAIVFDINANLQTPMKSVEIIKKENS